MINAAGVVGGSSGGKSFAFPEGFNGTPITYAISSGTTRYLRVKDFTY